MSFQFIEVETPAKDGSLLNKYFRYENVVTKILIRSIQNYITSLYGIPSADR